MSLNFLLIPFTKGKLEVECRLKGKSQNYKTPR